VSHSATSELILTDKTYIVDTNDWKAIHKTCFDKKSQNFGRMTVLYQSLIRYYRPLLDQAIGRVFLDDPTEKTNEATSVSLIFIDLFKNLR
jgi:hypothetical protein